MDSNEGYIPAGEKVDAGVTDESVVPVSVDGGSFDEVDLPSEQSFLPGRRHNLRLKNW